MHYPLSISVPSLSLYGLWMPKEMTIVPLSLKPWFLREVYFTCSPQERLWLSDWQNHQALSLFSEMLKIPHNSCQSVLEVYYHKRLNSGTLCSGGILLPGSERPNTGWRVEVESKEGMCLRPCSAASAWTEGGCGDLVLAETDNWKPNGVSL